MSTDERMARRIRSVLPGGADAAVLAVSDLATRRAAAAVVSTLETRGVVEQLARRWASVGNPQRAGHLFEVMHAGTFNRNAARQGATARAYVEAWTDGGSPIGTTDIRLVAGTTVRRVQAKVIGNPVRAARALAFPAYTGMDRLVPSDTVEAIDRVLDKALTRPSDGVFFADYADARSHTTTALKIGGVRSDPTTTAAAHAAARDPIAWANRLVAGAAGRQVATAAATGAAAGALLGGVTATAAEVARARAGETSVGVAVLTVAGATARNAVRSGATAAFNHSARIAGATGLAPKTLGTGPIPAAVADAVVGVGDAGLAYARGTIDAGEFAARSSRATMRASLVWASTAAGQTVIPVPVVGALVGGIVGQAAAVLVTQGLQLAISAARAEKADPHLVEILEAEAMTTVATAAALRDLTHQIGSQHQAYATASVLPQLAELTAALGSDPPTAATDTLTALTLTYTPQPIFGTVDEFDQWMTSRRTTLILNPNR